VKNDVVHIKISRTFAADLEFWLENEDWKAENCDLRFVSYGL